MRIYSFGAYYLPMRSDPEYGFIPSSDFAYHAANAYILKESLENFDIPLWSKYTLSGMPFYSKPQVPVFSLTWLFLLAPGFLGLKLSFLIHLLLGGIGMYLFMNYYFRKPKTAFFTALIYMFNGNLNSEILVGHFNILNVYAFLPFILLFALKAMNENWAYSIISGSFASFLILGGSPQESIFALFFIAFFIALNAVGKNLLQKFIRSLLLGLIILLVFLGLSAIKSFPTLELLKISQRQSGLSFESLVGDGVFRLNNFHQEIFRLLSFPSLFLLLSFASIKKKKVLIFFTLLLFSILMLSKSPLIYALWKYVPFVNKMRGIFKAIFIFTFPACVLSGVGMSYLIGKCELKAKSYANLLSLAIFLLIIFSLAVPFQKEQRFGDLKSQLERNNVMQYISKDKDIFRFKVFETNGIDWGTDFYSVPLKLQDIYGYDNIWLPEYLPVFLSIANTQPAKFFGMLNMKYITSINEVNLANFTLVKKFEECGTYDDGIEICQPKKSDGPYLYRNELFLPRAFFTEKNILVTGDKNNLVSMVYFLLTNNNFNPSDTAVISFDSIEELSIDFLRKFDIILIVGGTLTPNSIDKLTTLSKEKAVIPDIAKKEKTITEKGINDALILLNNNVPNNVHYFYPSPVAVEYLSSDEVEIGIGGKEGILLLSEVFSLFPGWIAKLDGKEAKILKANNILSAVYVPKGSNKLELKYEPGSFIIGKRITLATILALFLFYAFALLKSKKLQKRNYKTDKERSALSSAGLQI